jgi:tungstate transport system ATP-binding protein
MMDSTIGSPALEIENLVYRYPDATARVSEFALSILSFSAETRSITVLTGENGSGKTTLLKILAGLIEPSSGSIQGSDCVLVHQEPYLLHGSVEKNVAYGLRVRRMPSEERKARVASCLDAVGLAGFGRRRADRLSGGERQRVALARALAVRPDVLLLDEPTASVDAKSVGRLEEIIAGIVAGGTTMVITSHDVVFSYRVADTIVCLDHGTMVPTEVNVLKGRISRSDERFSYFSTGSVEIRCTIQSGDFRSAVIPYDDVILSAGTIDSSAQNQFRGVVTAVVPSGGRFRVDIDCGFRLSSVVTGYSIEKLGVSIGAELYVIFKASAMRVY